MIRERYGWCMKRRPRPGGSIRAGVVTCAARGQVCRGRISVLLVSERLLWRAVANMNSGALGSRPELQ